MKLSASRRFASLSLLSALFLLQRFKYRFPNMSYSDFTLKQAKDKLGLQIIEDRDLFSTIKEITISELLSATLKYNIPLAMAVGTEKARSELIIANILLEVRKILNNQISLFSGVIFSGEFVECGDSSPLSEPCGDESPHSTC